MAAPVETGCYHCIWGFCMTCNSPDVKRRCEFHWCGWWWFSMRVRKQTGKIIDKLNLTGNSSPCSRQFGTRSTLTETSGDPVYFVWNKWPSRRERHIPAKLWMNVSSAPLRVIFHSGRAACILHIPITSGTLVLQIPNLPLYISRISSIHPLSVPASSHSGPQGPFHLSWDERQGYTRDS